MSLWFYVCFLDGLKPSLSARLMHLEWQETDGKCASHLGRTSTVSRDQGIHFTGQIIQALMKTLQTSWNNPYSYHSQSSGQVRTYGILKLKISKVAETTGLPTPQVLPLVLLPVCSNPFVKHKTPSHEIGSSRLMYISIRLSVNPLLSHTGAVSYCKSFMCCTKADDWQVREVFLDLNSKDPFGHSLEPGDWVYWKCHQRKTALESHWSGLY